MSIAIMKLAWETTLPPPEKLILLSLADQANDEGVTWPSVSAIVKRTNLSDRSVFRYLVKLERSGHIHREQRMGSSTIYHVHPLETLTPDTHVTTDRLAPLTPMSPTPDTHVTQPLTLVAGTPATVGRQNHQESPIESPIEPPVTREAHFDQFWIAYPKKTGKGAALKSWQKLKAGKTVLEKILTALQWQTTSPQWTRDGGQYIPNPSTYLNQERWLDEMPVVVNSNLSEVGQRGAANMVRWLEQEGFSEDQIYGGVK